MSNAKRRHRSRGSSMPYETRELLTSIEVRDGGKANPDSIIVQGTPIQYNTPYLVRDALGEFSETMHPGVVSDVIKSCDTRFLINHSGLPLARTVSGTLQLTDTQTGLKMRAVLDARQQMANDLAVSIERGDVSAMSCGFVVGRDSWDSSYENRDIYSFTDFPDVSAVTYPASPTTDISIAERALMALPEEEQIRTLRFLKDILPQIRSGKAISNANAKKLAKILDHVTKAGGHAKDLLSIDGDGSIGGIVSGPPNGGGPGIGNPDGSGSRDAYGRKVHLIDVGKLEPAAQRDGDMLNLLEEQERDAAIVWKVKQAREEIAREDRELQRIQEAAAYRQQLARDLKI